MSVQGTADVVPFTIRVPDSDLGDLRDRLANARWAAEPDGGGDQYGVSRVWMQEAVEYWATGYDWRSWEGRLNRHPQFTTTIDGTNVHFLHVRSSEPRALPLILSHGWPGSVVEFLDVIGPLSEPRKYGLDPAVSFDLVIPSLPGFAWSGPTLGTATDRRGVGDPDGPTRLPPLRRGRQRLGSAHLA